MLGQRALLLELDVEPVRLVQASEPGNGVAGSPGRGVEDVDAHAMDHLIAVLLQERRSERDERVVLLGDVEPGTLDAGHDDLDARAGSLVADAVFGEVVLELVPPDGSEEEAVTDADTECPRTGFVDDDLVWFGGIEHAALDHERVRLLAALFDDGEGEGVRLLRRGHGDGGHAIAADDTRDGNGRIERRRRRALVRRPRLRVTEAIGLDLRIAGRVDEALEGTVGSARSGDGAHRHSAGERDEEGEQGQ